MTRYTPRRPRSVRAWELEDEPPVHPPSIIVHEPEELERSTGVLDLHGNEFFATERVAMGFQVREDPS